MSPSLQDQLLKAGLANKKQAVKAKKAQNHKEKQKRAGKDVVDEASASAESARKAQVERDKALNKQQVELAQQKAVAAQIKQLVSLNRIEERGEESYSFNHDGLVKSISLISAHRSALTRGALALVVVDDKYDLVPRPVADKIAERDDACVVVSNANVETEADDDEYAEFQVPDDLMW